ncbi:hypothetical protein CZ774_00135 [Frigoribacterium sp. JB110]|nr:hypothetical protein CZ774_00135 [Frigoribacterium sp. JB110]
MVGPNVVSGPDAGYVVRSRRAVVVREAARFAVREGSDGLTAAHRLTCSANVPSRVAAH